MNNPRGLLWQRRVLAIVMLALLLAALMGWHWGQAHLGEPVYGGKRLSEWLYPVTPDFVWIPNDLYGHIHDEFWDRLIDPSGSSKSAPITTGFEPGAGELPRFDAHAIPWLVRWMGARPNWWDRVRHEAAARLPAELAAWVDSSTTTIWGQSYIRWHVAAFKGLTLLGTNATAALPALSNLLCRTDADLPLTWAIANIGPQGMALLTNVLASGNAQMRDNAALALGLHYAQARMALPALAGCVERGTATYHVLGAIGRIGGEDPRLVPALVTWLDSPNRPAGVAFDDTMAILVLGLEGTRARAAIPVLRSRYQSAAAAGDKAACRLLRRVLKNICLIEDQLPPPGPGENGTDWP